MLIKQALGQGLLLGYRPSDMPPTFSEGDHRSQDLRFTADSLQLLRDRLAPIRARFGSTPAELARVALRYAFQHAPDATVLVGFRNAVQIHTNVTCLGEPLLPQEIADIRAVLHTGPDSPNSRKVIPREVH